MMHADGGCIPGAHMPGVREHRDQHQLADAEAGYGANPAVAAAADGIADCARGCQWSRRKRATSRQLKHNIRTISAMAAHCSRSEAAV